MSAASCTVTPRSGIALPGLIVCGETSQRIIASGEFGNTPATNARVAMPSSGGPTGALLPTMPGMT